MRSFEGTRRRRLGELLVEAGAVTATQLEDGLERQRAQGGRLGECLVALGHLQEPRLVESLAQQHDLPPVDLPSVEIPKSITRLIPVDFVREHRLIPFALHNGTLRVATELPGDAPVIENLRLMSGLEIEEAVASGEAIDRKIAECYQVTVDSLFHEFGEEEEGATTADNLHDIEVMASEPTVINLVNLIISTAVRDRASDIHLVPFEAQLELRYRIDGILQEVAPPPRHLTAAIISRIKIMAQMNIAERYLPQDGHFQIQHEGRRVDVRVGTMPTIYGESVVMRLLEKGADVQSITQLGLDDERNQELDAVVRKPHGIFLATGPTGSGKTTTLYSILHSIRTSEKKILTIEDPVEYELPGVGQIPVRPARGFTFATGLRAILRQDPDIVMVGEIRDSETAEIAIRAALTGHLVFSTLHTNDAAGAVTRLIDMGVEPFLIASSVGGVIAQRLVRTICKSCREWAPIDPELVDRLRTLAIEPKDQEYAHGSGCDACRQTGYSGRTGLYELLIFTPELRQKVLDRASSADIKKAALDSMITIRQDGLRKVESGETTFDELLRVAMGDVDA